MFKHFIWYSRSFNNTLAQMIHACIRLSSHCNFIHLKFTLRHYQNMLFSVYKIFSNAIVCSISLSHRQKQLLKIKKSFRNMHYHLLNCGSSRVILLLSLYASVSHRPLQAHMSSTYYLLILLLHRVSKKNIHSYYWL